MASITLGIKTQDGIQGCSLLSHVQPPYLPPPGPAHSRPASVRPSCPRACPDVQFSCPHPSSLAKCHLLFSERTFLITLPRKQLSSSHDPCPLCLPSTYYQLTVITLSHAVGQYTTLHIFRFFFLLCVTDPHKTASSR